MWLITTLLSVGDGVQFGVESEFQFAPEVLLQRRNIVGSVCVWRSTQNYKLSCVNSSKTKFSASDMLQPLLLKKLRKEWQVF